MKGSALKLTIITMAAIVIVIAFIYIRVSNHCTAEQTVALGASVIALVMAFFGGYAAIAKWGANRENKANKLNSEGLRNLLELHFGAVSHKMVYMADAALIEFENNPEIFDAKRFYKNASTIVSDCRAKLHPYQTESIPNISEFLDKHFSLQDLNNEVEEVITIMQSERSREGKAKAIYKVIQSAQGELQRKIQSLKID